MRLPTQTFSFTLLTPCFSGTALGKAANHAVMRIPPIRGHVRSWHRGLFGASSANSIWGSTDGQNAHASRVGLYFASSPIEGTKKAKLLPHANPQSRDNQERRKAESSAPAIPEGTSFALILQRYPACTNDDWGKAIKAMKCWLLLGGLGLRSNRAAGSVWPLDNWAPKTPEALKAILQEIGVRTTVQIAGWDNNFSPAQLRETASDTIGGTGRNHPRFGGIRPRQPSPTKFKVIRLGDRHALLITGSALEAAYQELLGKSNNSRWLALDPWRALYRPSP